MTDLLDSDVLIALCVPAHPHHEFAQQWVDSHPLFAACPITEGAVARYIYRVSSEGRGPEASQDALLLLQRYEGYKFWPADLSYRDAPVKRVRGHKQVTDAYLVGLAVARGGRLATFDRALVAVHPESILVPRFV